MVKNLKYSGVKKLLHSIPESVEPKKRTTLYIDPVIYHNFQQICLKNQRSISEVIEAAMQDIINNESK